MYQKIRSVAGGVIFLVLSAGGALAMPAAFDAEPEQEVSSIVADPPEDLELEPVEVSAEGETTDVTVPDEEGGEGDSDADKPENHGKAVSTAAHCELKGRAKGELVSSVARDKTATAATAQAACDAAVAAQETAPANTKPARPAKPSKSAKPAKAPKAVEAPQVEDASTDTAPTGGPPAHAGPPAGQGNSKKP